MLFAEPVQNISRRLRAHFCGAAVSVKEGRPSVWVSKPQMDDSGVVGDAPVDDCMEKTSS